MQRRDILIDLSDYDLNGTGSIIHHNYIVHYNNGDVSIFPSENQETIEIVLGNFKNDDGKITLHGNQNNVILSGSNVRLHELKINAAHLVFEEDFKMVTDVTKLACDKIENFGSIQSSVMSVDIANASFGVINNGNLDVTDQYEQSHGSFINANTFHADKFLIENGNMVWHKENSTCRIDTTQQIDAKSFIIDADIQAKSSLAKAEFIAIRKNIVGDLLLLAGENLHVYEHANIQCTSTTLAATKSLIIEGKLQQGNQITALGKTIHLTSSAVVSDSRNLTLKAQDILKCHSGASLKNINQIIASGQTLFLDAPMHATESLDLNCDLYAILSADANLGAADIRLHGNDYMLYGKLSGNISTPEPIHHLYLGAESQVDQCRHLLVKAIHIDAKGKMAVDLNELTAQTAIDVARSSVITGQTQKMLAEDVHLSGKMNVKDIHATANHHVSCDLALEVNSNSMKTTADAVTLDGVIHGDFTSHANTIFNEARITAENKTDLTGNKTIVNTEISAIYSKNSNQKGKTIVDKGEIVTDELFEEIALDLFQDECASQQSGKSQLNAERGVLAGKVKAKKSVGVSMSESLLFSTSNDLHSESASLTSANLISGPVRLNTKSATIASKNRASILKAEINASDSVTMSSNDLQVDGSVKTPDLKLLQNPDDKNHRQGKLQIKQESTIETKKFVENFDKCVIAGDMSVGSAIMHSKEKVKVTEKGKIHFDQFTSAVTSKFKFDGQLTSAHQNNENKNAGLFVEAQVAEFEKNTNIDILIPMNVRGSEVSYSGNYKAPAIHTCADKTTFASGCNIKPETWDVTVSGNSTNAIVNVEAGAVIKNRETIIRNIDKLKVSGDLASKLIVAKLNELHITASGCLGSDKSTLHIDADDFYLDGVLQADVGMVRCTNQFIQNGLAGIAKIKVNKIDITSYYYLNFLGTTEARQATFTSFFAAFLGFEFIFSKVDNSLIKVKALPTFTHLEFLESTIQSILNGDIDILDANHIQYSIQATLAILTPFLPSTVTQSANIIFNSYFLYNNLSQLNEMLKTFDYENARPIDFLPLLVAIKNSTISGVLLADNACSLITSMKNPILDTITDTINYIQNDLVSDVIDLFHFHKTSNDGDNAGTKPDDPKKDDGNKPNENKPAPPATDTRPEKTDPSFSENIKDKFNKFSLYDFTHDSISTMLSILNVLGPSAFSDNLIGINLLSPIFTGMNSERSLINFTWNSPVIGLSSMRTGVAVIDLTNDWAYLQNTTSYYAYLGSDATHSHHYHLKTKHLAQAAGTKVRADHVILDLPKVDVYDIKGDISTTFIYSTVANDREAAFLQLKDEFKNYQPDDPGHATINYVTDHDYVFDKSHFNKDLCLPWGATYKGTSVKIDINIETKGETLGFSSTKGSVTNLGHLKAKESIFMDSADRLYEYKGSTDSKNLFLRARTDLDLVESNNQCESGTVIAERGHCLVDAGDLEASRILVLKAHTDIIDNCQSTAIKHNGGPDKQYRPGHIKGGDGYGFHGIGLYAEADGKVLVNGSEMGAIGDFVIIGDHGIKADAPHNPYIYKSKHHHKFFVLKKDEVVISEHIQRPVFKSDHGYGYFSTQHGRLESLATDYDANHITVFSRMAPEFKDLTVKTVSSSKMSILKVPLYNKLHIESERIGQNFLSPKSLGITCKYGDIVIPNSNIKTELLITDTDGKVLIYQDPIEVYDRNTYLTMNFNAGPLHYSHSFNPDDPHPDRVWVQDPLIDALQSRKNTHDAVGKGCVLVNSSDAAIGKATAIMSGNYAGAAGASFGGSYGYTTTESYYQKSGNHSVEIGYCDDYSSGVFEIRDIPASIGILDRHCGEGFKATGAMYNFATHSTSTTLGASCNVVTSSVSLDGSHSYSKSEGSVAAPCQVHIGHAILRNGGIVTADIANIEIDKLFGTVEKTEVISKVDVIASSSTSVSASTNGSLNINHSNVHGNVVNQESSLTINDMTNGHVVKATVVGGKLLGEGLKNSLPDSVDVTPISSHYHESEFGISLDAANKSVSNISYTNARDIRLTGGATKHHGVRASLNAPSNLFSLFKSSQKEIELERKSTVNNETSAQQNNKIAVFDDEYNIDYLLEDSALDPGYAVYDADGNYYGFVPLSKLNQHNANHEADESEHGLHFPTPKEMEEVWSLPLEDELQTVFRGSKTPPEIVFKRGFIARGKNTDIINHIIGNGIQGGADDSAYISTSKSIKKASMFPVMNSSKTEITYIYEINLPKYAIKVDVDEELSRRRGTPVKYGEDEISVKDRIRAGNIVGAYKNVRFPYNVPSTEKNAVIDVLTENPNYRKVWSLNELSGKAAMGVSYGLTALAIANDRNAILEAWSQSKDSYAPVAHEIAFVAGKWTGASIAGNMMLPYLEKSAAFAISKAPILANCNPWAKLLVMIGSTSEGAAIGGAIADGIYKHPTQPFHTIIDGCSQLARNGIFSAQTLGRCAAESYRHPLPSQYIPFMPGLF